VVMNRQIARSPEPEVISAHLPGNAGFILN
jgi:hypothetical protein